MQEVTEKKWYFYKENTLEAHIFNTELAWTSQTFTYFKILRA